MRTPYSIRCCTSDLRPPNNQRVDGSNCVVVPVQVPPRAATQDETPEDAFWRSVLRGDSVDEFRIYLKQYPNGRHVSEARSRIEKLNEKISEQNPTKKQVRRLTQDRQKDQKRPESLESIRDSALKILKIAYPDYQEITDSPNFNKWVESLPAVRQEEIRTSLDPSFAIRVLTEYKSIEARRVDAEAEALRPGKVFKDCLECPDMVVIPAGTFEMGSPSSETDRNDNEGPQHRVTLAKAFALAKTEITRGQFAAFVKDSGYSSGNECNVFESGKWEIKSGKNWRDPGYTQTDSHPMACISWDDAKTYASWLAKKSGKPYRLPSEAEWEYAARAGTRTIRYWGDDLNKACTYANVTDQTKSPSGLVWVKKHECDDGHWFSAPVESYRSNAFGLYDMIGNVWEWTQDCWNGNYSGAPSDGSAWTNGDCGQRVLRGGSWSGSPQVTRAAGRDRGGTTYRSDGSGFRLARMLP